MDRYAREAKDRPLTNVHHLSQRPPVLFGSEGEDILFSEEDAKWVNHPHADALVVKDEIGPTNVHRVLVDNRSAVNVLTYGAYKKIGFLDKEMSPTNEQIYDFTRASVGVKGVVHLPVSFG